MTFPGIVFGEVDPVPTAGFVSIVAALSIGLFFAIRYLGMRQFGAEDGGITAVIAYMVKLGYVPYSEIQTTGFPPLYVVLGGWAFRVLGDKWQSLVTLAAAASVLGLSAQAWVGRRAGFGAVTAIAVAFMVQCATLLPLSGWWYNQLTSVVGALFVTASLAFVVNPRSRAASVGFLLAAGLVSWCKPNVAALLLLGVGIVLLVDTRLRIRGLALLAGAAALSLLGLVVVGIDPRNVVSSYLDAGARLTADNFELFFLRNDNLDVNITMALLVPAFVAAAASLGVWLTRRGALEVPSAFLGIAVLSVITGLVAMGTNNDHNLVDAPLVVLGFLACVHAAGRSVASRAGRLALAIAICLSLAGLSAYGVVSATLRYRIYSIGPERFYEDVVLRPVGGPPMMADVRTGPIFRRAVGAISQLASANPTAFESDGVFFGPRLLVMYPEFGVAPPKSLPTWWMLYKDGLPRTAEAVQAFKADQRPLLVFYQEDYTDFPGSLRRAILERYQAYKYENLTLHVLKGSDVQVPPRAEKFDWNGRSQTDPVD